MWALRAQTDKLEYAREMRRELERTPNLHIREGMAVDLELGPNDEVTGAQTGAAPCFGFIQLAAWLSPGALAMVVLRP